MGKLIDRTILLEEQFTSTWVVDKIETISKKTKDKYIVTFNDIYVLSGVSFKMTYNKKEFDKLFNSGTKFQFEQKVSDYETQYGISPYNTFIYHHVPKAGKKYDNEFSFIGEEFSVDIDRMKHKLKIKSISYEDNDNVIIKCERPLYGKLNFFKKDNHEWKIKLSAEKYSKLALFGKISFHPGGCKNNLKIITTL